MKKNVDIFKVLGSGLFTPSRHTSTLLFSVKVKATSCAKDLSIVFFC